MYFLIYSVLREREREGGVVFVYFFAYHYNLTVYESRVVFSYYA